MAEFVRVTNPNNRPDRIYYGCVPYEYSIGKYQVTNEEWCAFLNGVGAEKALNLKLWHKDMSFGVLGGISEVEKIGGGGQWRGSSFVVKPGWEGKPVVYVRYVDVCRYCNWLQTGDVEKGAYDLSGEVPQRVKGAKYALPTDDEWYKAAYYNHGRYQTYPTGDELPRLDQMNYERGDELSKGPPYYLADVDEYAAYPSPCGAVQMGGNAWELLENVRIDKQGQRLSTYRGGSFGYTETGPGKYNCDIAPYNGRCYVFGVRLAFFENGWYPIAKPFKYRVRAFYNIQLGRAKRIVKRLVRLRRH